MQVPISCASFLLLLSLVLPSILLAQTPSPTPGADPALGAAAQAARTDLISRYGQTEAARIDRGLGQVLRQWRTADGGPAELKQFVAQHFVPTGPQLDATFERLEYAMERLDGYFGSMALDLKRGIDLDQGPLLPLDTILGAFEPAAHVSDDLFSNKLAFVALLNFPVTTLSERLAQGATWTRRQWAETRLANRFTERIPAEALQALAQASSEAEVYTNGYNIHLHHVLTADGQRLFPAGLRLINHWNLRDEIRARYADREGLPKQRLITLVMDKIVRQEIPAAVIDNPKLDWTPATGAVTPAAPTSEVGRPDATNVAKTEREPDTRYERWLGNFKANRLIDRYVPDFPSRIARAFDSEREIPEAEVRTLFEQVLTAPTGKEVAKIIAARLGRPLEPFDIWYTGFRPRAQFNEAELDQLTRQRYPTPGGFAADMPRILTDLGFSAEQARFLSERVVVEPSRGPGHAAGASRPDDLAHLRTRVGALGMDYKGYNIAIHEFGHNCEQVFSTSAIDHNLLRGVPNTAFTEALAFLFQERDLELLGLTRPTAETQRLTVLDQFWAVREIAGVSLVDMAAWRWLYDHPDATPAQFRAAVVGIAQDVWNRYFADILGSRDVTILAVYAHMVMRQLYLPDYTLGHLIAFQIGEHFEKLKGPAFGAEFERITRLGRLTPDAWMRKALGQPLSAEPLLRAVQETLAAGGKPTAGKP